MERENKVGLICQYPLIPNFPDGVKDNTLGLAKAPDFPIDMFSNFLKIN